jgi:hypothetical protein
MGLMVSDGVACVDAPLVNYIYQVQNARLLHQNGALFLRAG